MTPHEHASGNLNHPLFANRNATTADPGYTEEAKGYADPHEKLIASLGHAGDDFARLPYVNTTGTDNPSCGRTPFQWGSAPSLLQMPQRWSQIAAAIGATVCLIFGAILIYYGLTRKALLKRDVDIPLPINTVLVVIGLVVRVGGVFGAIVAEVQSRYQISRGLMDSRKGVTVRQLTGLSGVSTFGEAARVRNLTWWPMALVLWAWITSTISKYSFIQGHVSETITYHHSITGYNTRYCGGSSTLGGACSWSPFVAIANTTASFQAKVVQMGGLNASQSLPGGMFTSPAVVFDASNNFYALPMPDIVFQNLQPGLTSLSIPNCPFIKFTSHCQSATSVPTFSYHTGTCSSGTISVTYCSGMIASSLNILALPESTVGTMCSVTVSNGTGNATWSGSPGNWVATLSDPTGELDINYSYPAESVQTGWFFLEVLQETTSIFGFISNDTNGPDRAKVGAAVAMISANYVHFADDNAVVETQIYNGSGVVLSNAILAIQWGALATGTLFIILSVSGLSAVLAASRRQLSVTPEQYLHAAANSEGLKLSLAEEADTGKESSKKFSFMDIGGQNQLRPVSDGHGFL